MSCGASKVTALSTTMCALAVPRILSPGVFGSEPHSLERPLKSKDRRGERGQVKGGLRAGLQADRNGERPEDDPSECPRGKGREHHLASAHSSCAQP